MPLFMTVRVNLDHSVSSKRGYRSYYQDLVDLDALPVYCYGLSGDRKGFFDIFFSVEDKHAYIYEAHT